MKPRIQSAVLLLATLAIGMLLGALLHSSLSKQRINRAFMLRNEANFIEAVETAIQPSGEAQAASIHTILQEAAPRIISQVRRNREELRAELDSIRASLQPLLDEDQQLRLDSRLYTVPKKKPARAN